MVFPAKRVTGSSASDTGSTTQVGGVDWNIHYDYYNDIDKTGPAKINTETWLRSGKFKLAKTSGSEVLSFNLSALTASRNVNYPNLTADDIPAFLAQAQTFTNKTISGASNTISNIPDSALSSNVVRTDKSNSFSGSFNQIFPGGRLHITDGGSGNDYWVWSGHITGGNDTDLFLPDIDTVANPSGSHLVAEELEATLSNKVLDSTCDISEALTGAIITPAGTQSGATVDINTTASETDILNYTVPGASMGANGIADFLITGYILANSGSPTYTFKIKFGGTTMYQGVTAAFGASATKIPFRIKGELQNKNATNAQSCNAMILINDTTATTTGIGDIGSAGTIESVFGSEGADTSKDTTIDQALQVTVTMSVNNSAVHTVVKSKQVRVYQAS